MNEHRTPSEAKPARMGALARLPVFLSLDGQARRGRRRNPRGSLEGGTAVGCRRASERLCVRDVGRAAATGCRFAAWGDRLHQSLHWRAEDLPGAAVAVGAFEDDEGAAAFAAAARAAGVPVNVIDKPAFCDFSFGAIVNRSPLVIGISTDGAAPVFAQAIRAKLEALLPKGFADWAAAAARWRGALKLAGLSFAGTAQVLADVHRPCRRRSRPRAGSGRFRQLHCRSEGPGSSGRERIGDFGRRRAGRSGIADACAPCARCSPRT